MQIQDLLASDDQVVAAGPGLASRGARQTSRYTQPLEERPSTVWNLPLNVARPRLTKITYAGHVGLLVR